jgi:hypothetical protein
VTVPESEVVHEELAGVALDVVHEQLLMVRAQIELEIEVEQHQGGLPIEIHQLGARLPLALNRETLWQRQPKPDRSRLNRLEKSHVSSLLMEGMPSNKRSHPGGK